MREKREENTGQDNGRGQESLAPSWHFNLRTVNSDPRTFICSMFFLPNFLCVHVRRLGTSVRKSTRKSDLQTLQNRYQCRSEQTNRSFVIQRRDIPERSHGLCRVESLVHACMWSLSRHGLLGIGDFSVKVIFILNFLKEPPLRAAAT